MIEKKVGHYRAGEGNSQCTEAGIVKVKKYETGKPISDTSVPNLTFSSS